MEDIFSWFVKNWQALAAIVSLISGIIFIIEIITRIAKKFSIISCILHWIKNLFRINKLYTRVDLLEKELAELKTKKERKFKDMWDNLDNAEKQELKQFKTKNTIRLDIRKEVISGLLEKDILKKTSQPSLELWGEELASCYVASEYIERLKEL